jgi:hypothetical protein
MQPAPCLEPGPRSPTPFPCTLPPCHPATLSPTPRPPTPPRATPKVLRYLEQHSAGALTREQLEAFKAALQARGPGRC